MQMTSETRKRRQAADAGWLGLATSKELAYAALTRARTRSYLFMEDLREEIILPDRGDLRREADRLGLRGNPQDASVNRHACKRQLWLAKALTCLETAFQAYGARAWWITPRCSWIWFLACRSFLQAVNVGRLTQAQTLSDAAAEAGPPGTCNPFTLVMHLNRT